MRRTLGRLYLVNIVNNMTAERIVECRRHSALYLLDLRELQWYLGRGRGHGATSNVAVLAVASSPDSATGSSETN